MIDTGCGFWTGVIWEGLEVFPKHFLEVFPEHFMENSPTQAL